MSTLNNTLHTALTKPGKHELSFELPTPFTTESGYSFSKLTIAFHTYGQFNPLKNNVIWVCHALTGNSDVFDWWNGLFGDQDYFNPQEHFIICANIIGSCYGSTGADHYDENGTQYLQNFPLVTTRDMAKAHELLRSELGIEQIKLLIGSSLGGQQAMEWAIVQPKRFERLILIATNARHSAFGIAYNESQRLAIYADRTYGKGSIDDAKEGLKVARSIAMISYRSYKGYELTQTDQETEKLDDYRASSYQRYQGQKLANRFNAYAYITLSKAMDSHHVGRGRTSIQDALKLIQAKTLVIGIDSDYLFPISEQSFLAEHIPNASFETISSDFGHDGFLVEGKTLEKIIHNWIELQ